MDKKNMYIVLKRDDTFKYLSEKQLSALEDILTTICDGRENDNKNAFNTYYVCNTDEPYAQTVHETIISGEAKKDGNKVVTYCPDACGTGCNECFKDE